MDITTHRRTSWLCLPVEITDTPKCTHLSCWTLVSKCWPSARWLCFNTCTNSLIVGLWDRITSSALNQQTNARTQRMRRGAWVVIKRFLRPASDRHEGEQEKHFYRPRFVQYLSIHHQISGLRQSRCGCERNYRARSFRGTSEKGDRWVAVIVFSPNQEERSPSQCLPVRRTLSMHKECCQEHQSVVLCRWHYCFYCPIDCRDRKNSTSMDKRSP